MVLENAQNNIKQEAQNESADDIKPIDVKPDIVEMDVLATELEDPNNMMDAAPNIEVQEASPKGRRKRSLDKTSSDDVTPKRAKRNGTALANISQHKSSVAVLNELRQNLVYKLISQAGPVHMPTFTMSVEVDGQVYEGTGRNKKMAKADAADNALRQFIQFRDGKTAAAAAVPNNLDFTSDDFSPLPNATDDIPVAPVEAGPVNMRLAESMREKGPVMLLNELYNDAQFALVSENGTQFAKFKMTVLINKQLYEGTGPSKKMAKAAAAKSALSALCNISYGQGRLNVGPSLGAAPSGDQRGESLPQAVVDHIGKLVIEKFNSLMENDPVHARRKVLAGIVMTRGTTNMEDSEVISVATGTKCVSGAYISARGRALNDSHAEIVARRCLIDYLYKQMELHVDPVTASKSILVRDPQTAKFKVQDSVKFHLYINTAPCGDARIFSPHEEHTAGVDKHPNRTARGQLRTKIESGEGTIPVKNSNGIQTWDGVIQGDRLLTMSCSDKLCRWNVVGVQGALLATVLEPLYLHSIVLGSLLHPVHMYRAICGRVEEHIQGLPPPYRLNKPLVSLLSSSEIRNPTKAPSFSVNWTTGMQEPEIVNSLNGTDLLGGSSRISKISLFKRYRTLIPKLMGYNFKMADVYSDIKASATEYKTAKDMVHDAFRKAGLGEWLCKPCEQDQFELEGEQ